MSKSVDSKFLDKADIELNKIIRTQLNVVRKKACKESSLKIACENCGDLFRGSFASKYCTLCKKKEKKIEQKRQQEWKKLPFYIQLDSTRKTVPKAFHNKLGFQSKKNRQS